MTSEPRCFSCGETGHIKAHCPARQTPSKTYQEHLAIIDLAVEAWIDDRISIDQKRTMISDENAAYYGPSCPKRLLWPYRGN